MPRAVQMYCPPPADTHMECAEVPRSSLGSESNIYHPDGDSPPVRQIKRLCPSLTGSAAAMGLSLYEILTQRRKKVYFL